MNTIYLVNTRIFTHKTCLLNSIFVLVSYRTYILGIYGLFTLRHVLRLWNLRYVFRWWGLRYIFRGRTLRDIFIWWTLLVRSKSKSDSRSCWYRSRFLRGRLSILYNLFLTNLLRMRMILLSFYYSEVIHRLNYFLRSDKSLRVRSWLKRNWSFIYIFIYILMHKDIYPRNLWLLGRLIERLSDRSSIDNIFYLRLFFNAFQRRRCILADILNIKIFQNISNCYRRLTIFTW